jgi:SSS family solute:Na+ symporter
MLAGFFLPRISAVAARTALFVGLAFYIIMTFILKVKLHFVHVWGIEFVLNIVTMYVVTYFFPREEYQQPGFAEVVSMERWKYSKIVGVILCVLTVGIYIWLGK